MKSRWIWDLSFTVGSVLAAFSQGVILGAIIHGIQVHDLVFTGSVFDCIQPFTITTGAALVVGYAFLGSTWLVMKTNGDHAGLGETCHQALIIYALAVLYHHQH